RTPLGASLRAAAEDLQGAEGSTVVILVTDGLESVACGGDPVAEAAALVGGSDQRKLHVIGFAVDDPVANETLRALAEAGKGLYFDADNSAQLADALRQAVELRYQIVTREGTEVAAGNVGQAPIQLPAGTYLLRINATPPIEKEFVVRDGDRLEVLIRQGFGGLIADVLRAVP
ncbi:MAG TPA: vWA domain-containing protein, partial [Herpetosiphonaceae bacterium]|nr:vWA domain-containing protein [Herpetosiphonaceae bacterium]